MFFLLFGLFHKFGNQFFLFGPHLLDCFRELSGLLYQIRSLLLRLVQGFDVLGPGVGKLLFLVSLESSHFIKSLQELLLLLTARLKLSTFLCILSIKLIERVCQIAQLSHVSQSLVAPELLQDLAAPQDVMPLSNVFQLFLLGSGLLLEGGYLLNMLRLQRRDVLGMQSLQKLLLLENALIFLLQRESQLIL